MLTFFALAAAGLLLVTLSSRSVNHCSESALERGQGSCSKGKGGLG